MKIYLVIGQTGDYSDRREWIICGYNKKEDADKHVELAQQEHNRWYSSARFRFPDENANPYDPDMSDHTEYKVIPVNIFDTVSEKNDYSFKV